MEAKCNECESRVAQTTNEWCNLVQKAFDKTLTAKEADTLLASIPYQSGLDLSKVEWLKEQADKAIRKHEAKGRK